MANIKKRKLKNGQTRYDAAYRDPSGKERSTTFRSRREAQRFAKCMELDVTAGRFFDPAHRNRSFAELAREWIASNPAKRSSTLAR